MSYYGDRGRDWRDSAETNAAIAVRQVFIKTIVRQGALAIAPSLIAIAVSVLVFYFACRAVGDIQGWVRWSAVGYLLALLVAGLVEATLFFRSLWTSVREVDPDAPAPPPGLAELNARRAWIVRVVTVPVGLLAVVYMTRVGFHSSVAVCFTVIGWLGVDVATLMSFPARRTLHRLRNLAQERPKNTPEM